jgi:hypothetical protein
MLSNELELRVYGILGLYINLGVNVSCWKKESKAWTRLNKYLTVREIGNV